MTVMHMMPLKKRVVDASATRLPRVDNAATPSSIVVADDSVLGLSHQHQQKSIAREYSTSNHLDCLLCDY